DGRAAVGGGADRRRRPVVPGRRRPERLRVPRHSGAAAAQVRVDPRALPGRAVRAAPGLRAAPRERHRRRPARPARRVPAAAARLLSAPRRRGVLGPAHARVARLALRAARARLAADAAAAGRRPQDRVNDLATHESWARLLAYAHPLWMLAALGLAALALRSGLGLRSARRRRQRRSPAALRRHVALAKPAIAAVAIGFVGGPLSLAVWAGRGPFG